MLPSRLAAKIDEAAAAYGLTRDDIEPSMLKIISQDESCLSEQLPRILRLTCVNNALSRRGLQPLSLDGHVPVPSASPAGSAPPSSQPPPQPQPEQRGVAAEFPLYVTFKMPAKKTVCTGSMTVQERQAEEELCLAGIDTSDTSILGGDTVVAEVCGVALDYAAYRSTVKHCKITAGKKAMARDSSSEAARRYILKWIHHIARNRWQRRLEGVRGCK